MTHALHLTPTDFAALDESQRTAMLEAMVIGLIADNQVNKAEVRRFDELVLGLPWGVPQPVLISMIAGARNRLVALTSESEFTDYLIALKERVPTDELRDKAVFAMATIMFSDGEIAKRERDILDLFGLAWAISRERIDAIKAALHVLPTAIPTTPTDR